MAQIIRKGFDLEKKYHTHRKRAIIGLLVGAAGLIAATVCGVIFSAALSRLTLLPMLVFVGGCLMASVEWREATIVRTGLIGERAATGVVSRLPDTYTVFTGLQVAYEDKQCELDLTVVGPSGVFVIEVKNHNGTIRGDREAHNWKQFKVGRKGTPYQKTLHSPIRQVRTHVYCLAGILEMRDIRVFVKDGVFFANPATVVELAGNSTRTPVFVAREDGGRELLRYLLQGDGQLSPELCARVIQRLKAL